MVEKQHDTELHELWGSDGRALLDQLAAAGEVTPSPDLKHRVVSRLVDRGQGRGRAWLLLPRVAIPALAAGAAIFFAYAYTGGRQSDAVTGESADYAALSQQIVDEAGSVAELEDLFDEDLLFLEEVV